MALQNDSNDQCGSRHKSHNPPEYAHRSLHRIEHSPEKVEQRELDKPQCCPHREVNRKLQFQEERCICSEVGSWHSQLHTDFNQLVHWWDGILVENRTGNVEEYGAPDEVVVEKESLATAVLNMCSENNKGDAGSYSYPHESLSKTSEVCIWMRTVAKDTYYHTTLRYHRTHCRFCPSHQSTQIHLDEHFPLLPYFKLSLPGCLKLKNEKHEKQDFAGSVNNIFRFHNLFKFLNQASILQAHRTQQTFSAEQFCPRPSEGTNGWYMVTNHRSTRMKFKQSDAENSSQDI